MRSLAVFALRVVLAEGSASWVMLACAPYIGVVEITENFWGYFARVWAAVRWVRGGGADFGTLAKGCSRTFGLPLGSLRSKILEDSEENLRKSEWKIGVPRSLCGHPKAAKTPPKAPDVGCCEEILKFFEVFLNHH